MVARPGGQPVNRPIVTLKKLRHMGYGRELLEDEFLARAEDLVRPEVQITSQCHQITDFEVNAVHSHLEAWVPVSCGRVILTFAILNPGHDHLELEEFRRCLLERGLNRQQTVLSLHKLGQTGLLPRIEVLQRLEAASALDNLKDLGKLTLPPMF
jgi:hypothetical protein